MDIQTVVVILCILIAAVFIGRRFLASMRQGTCAGCPRQNCCDSASCPEGKVLKELKPK